MKVRILILMLSYILVSGFDSPHYEYEFTEYYRIKLNNTEYFTCDNMGNIYVSNSKGDITKYNKEGKQVAVANYKSLGQISSIDASNPFEIYVFYKEQNKILYFDNQLNLLGSIDFEAGNFFMLSSTARSFDNKIWVFDLSDLKLKKIKKDLTEELSSGNVREFSSKKNIYPSYIIDANKYVYLFDSTIGLLQFDYFGNYIREITFTNVTQFFTMSGDIYFLKNDSVYKLNNELLSETTLPIKNKPAQINAFSISSNRLVLQSGNELILYAPNNNK